MTNELAVKQIEDRASTMLADAEAFSISTNADLMLADERCVALMALQKEVEATFSEPKQKAHEAHRAIVAAENRHMKPIQEARQKYRVKMGAWQAEQEKKRQAEERRLQEDARKLEEDQKIAEAKLHEDAGDHEVAEAIISAPVVAPVVVLPSSTPKTRTAIRSIPDLSKIEKALKDSKYALKIPGVIAEQVWTVKVYDSKQVPEQYRRPA